MHSCEANANCWTIFAVLFGEPGQTALRLKGLEYKLDVSEKKREGKVVG